MAIVSRLGITMKARKVTLDQLSAAVNVTRVNLSRIRSGTIRAVRFSTIDAICKFLECGMDDVLVYIPDEQLTDEDIVCYRLEDDDSYLEE